MNQPRPMQDTLADAKLIYEFLSSHEKQDAHADILLIPGSHDLRVADHAARLFLQGRADWLVCSGGYGKITDGTFDKPEAVLFMERCVQQGVDESKVIPEPEATNTGENFTFSRRALAQRGIVPATGLIVCKPYMAVRALATAQKQWPQVKWMVDAAPIAFEHYATPDTPLEQLVELMVGDLQRLQVYADKGFQTPVSVPQPVWQAWERLANDGYDRFVIREDQ